MANALLDLGLKAAFGKKAKDVKKGVGIAADVYKAVKPKKPTPKVIAPKVQEKKPWEAGYMEKPLYPAAEISAVEKKPPAYEAFKQALANLRKHKEQRRLLSSPPKDVTDEFMESDYFKPDYSSSLVNKDLAFTKPQEIIDKNSFMESLELTRTNRELRRQAAQQLASLPHDKQMEFVEAFIEKKTKAYEEDSERAEMEWEEQMRKKKQVLQEELQAGAITGGFGATKYFPSSPVREFKETAGGEWAELAREALIDIPGAATRGYVIGRTMGIAGVLEPYNVERQKPIHKENLEYFNNLKNIENFYGIIGNFAGQFKTWSNVAGFIKGRILGKIGGPAGKFMAKHSNLTAYGIQNASEEVFQMGVFKLTGQDYTFNDFVLGMALGAGFETIGRAGKAFAENSSKVLKEANEAIKNAEIEKGYQMLTPQEVEAAVSPVRINDDFVLGDLYKETRLAYKTGAAMEVGERGMTQLKSRGMRPSVTDIGVRVGAEPELRYRPEVLSERLDVKGYKKIKGDEYRDVFDLGDDRVVKVAKDKRGLALNRVEVDNPHFRKILEEGKDYVIVEKLGEDKKAVKQFLKPLKKFKDFELGERAIGFERTMEDMGLKEFLDHDVNFKEFKNPKNWGVRDDGTVVLMNEGVLKKGAFKAEQPDYKVVEEWKEIEEARKGVREAPMGYRREQAFVWKTGGKEMPDTGKLSEMAREAKSFEEFEKAISTKVEGQSYRAGNLKSAIEMKIDEPGGHLANYDYQAQKEWLGGAEPPKDGKITLYRATGEGKEIMPGDYVTNSRQYAQEHIKANLGGEGKITSIEATLKDIYPADGPKEFKYVPDRLKQYKSLEDFYSQSKRGEFFKSQPKERLAYKTGGKEMPDTGRISEEARIRAEGKELLPWEEGYKMKKKAEVKKVRKPIEIDTPEAKEVLDELAVVEKGSRVWKEGRVVGEVRSTFPEWIPKDLRSKALTEAVVKHINEGTVPSVGKQRELFDIVANKIEGKSIEFRDLTVREKARADIMAKIKEKQGRIENVKKELVKYAKENLDLRERGKLLATVKNAKTWNDLDKAKGMIERLGKSAERKYLTQAIDKELKKLVSKKGEKGKTTPEFEMLRTGYKEILSNSEDVNLKRLEELQERMNLEKEGKPIDFQERVTYALLLENTKGGKELSNNELRDILTRLQQTRKIARDSFLWKTIEEGQRISKKIETAKQVMNTKGVSEDILTNRKSILDKIWEAISTVDIMDRGFKQIINLLDKAGHSRFFRDTLFQPIVEAHKAYMPQKFSFIEKDNEMFRNVFGIKKTKGASSITQGNLLDRKVKGLTAKKHVGVLTDAKGEKFDAHYSDAELIDIYISSKMKANKKAMVENGIYIGGKGQGKKIFYPTEDNLKQLIDNMSPEAKKVADHIMKSFEDKDFMRQITDAYEAKFNKPFPKVEGGYWTLNRRYVGTGEKEIDLSKAEFQQKGIVSPSSFKERVNSKEPIVIKDAFTKYIKWREDALRFIHYDKQFSEMLSVINSREFKSTFTEAYGEKAYKHLYDSFFYMANGGELHSDLSAKATNVIRSVLAIQHLGGRSRALVSQGSSALAASADMPYQEFVKYFAEATAHPKRAFDKMMESPLVRFRHKQANFNKGLFETEMQSYSKQGTKLDEIFMAPVRGGDMLGVIGAGYPVYKYNFDILSKTMPKAKAEKIAMQRAENFIVDTQQSSLPEYANKIMQSHPAVRTMGAYQQSPSMYRAKGYEAIREWQNSAKTPADTRKMIKQVATYHLVLPSIFELSKGNFNPFSIASNSLLSPITGVMGYGKVVSYGVQVGLLIPLMKAMGVGDDDIDAMQPFSPLPGLGEDALRIFNNTVKGAEELFAGEAGEKELFNILKGIGTLTKVPVKNIKEEISKVQDVISGEGGLQRLLETEWQYEQRQKGKEETGLFPQLEEKKKEIEKRTQGLQKKIDAKKAEIEARIAKRMKGL